MFYPVIDFKHTLIQSLLCAPVMRLQRFKVVSTSIYIDMVRDVVIYNLSYNEDALCNLLSKSHT